MSMGVWLLFTVWLMLLAHRVSLYPLDENCKLCDPGYYQESCVVCAPCPTGFYTQRKNKEQQCHPCSRDCKPEFNMEVIEPCSTRSNLRCRCKTGYTCTRTESFSQKCLHCGKVLSYTTVKTNAGNTSHTTTQRPIHSPQSKDASSQWWVILVVISIGVFALIVLFGLSYSHRQDTCLKQLMKSCFPGSDKPTINEATPRGPMAAAHCEATQPDSLPADNHSNSPASSQPGPLYINHSSTVFVSLLNQFGFGGGGGGREEGQERAENGDARPKGSEVPSPSSPIPLSTEERSREGNTSVPFQEQGKESHVSKEEEF